MALATLVFWMGRHHYVFVPPTGSNGPAGFMSITLYALTHLGRKKPGQSFYDVALEKYSAAEVEGAKAALGIFKVFVTVTIFWALFDQQGSSWTLQAKDMDLHFMGMQLEASQIQALNPILVMLLIPFFSWVVYPLVEKLGFKVTPLRKMSAGMMLAGLSFVIVGLMQVMLDSGTKLSVAWQIVPYIIITCSEVMVSITGLEFAYTQAPRSMKSTIMSFWLLTVAFGNMLDAVIAKIDVFTGAHEFFFFAGLMFLVSIVFVIGAVRYKAREFIEHEAPVPGLGGGAPGGRLAPSAG
jgi:POT family proton-dependent oligopeptide transporter